MIPRVPSAPMKSLVVSNPADDLRDLRRVLITSPEGKTTVLGYSGHWLVRSIMKCWTLPHSRTIRPWPFHIEQHLLERWCIISIICDNAHALPEQPVLIIPPIVAPGAGSIFQIVRYLSERYETFAYREKERNSCENLMNWTDRFKVTNDSMYLFPSAFR